MMKGIPSVTFSKGGVEYGYRYAVEEAKKEDQTERKVPKKRKSIGRK